MTLRRWFEGNEDEIQALLARRVSAARIGAMMGVSRNAVVGLAHRKGWKFTARPYAAAELRGGREPRPSQARAETRVYVQNFRREKPSIPLPAALASASDAPAYLGTPFCDLPDGACRWIDGDPAHDAPSCGSPGYPYCPHHARLTYSGRY